MILKCFFQIPRGVYQTAFRENVIPHLDWCEVGATGTAAHHGKRKEDGRGPLEVVGGLKGHV